jgi:hypothetical protein
MFAWIEDDLPWKQYGLATGLFAFGKTAVVSGTGGTGDLIPWNWAVR